MDSENIAWQIIEQFWELSVPVDVYTITRKMGVEIQEDPNLPVSGEFNLGEENKPLIKINTSENPLRQRFTLAHELGHFVLNHGSAFRDPVANFFSNVWDKKEVQANQFAAALLMPELAVRYFIDNEKITSTQKLSEYFKVSSTAMMYRLRNLGIVR